MATTIISSYEFGDMTFQYILDMETRMVGLIMVPAGMEEKINPEKEYTIDSILQLKLVGDDYPFAYAQGKTMRNAGSVRNFTYSDQYSIHEKDAEDVVTVFIDKRGYRVEHWLKWYKCCKAVEVFCIFKNESKQNVSLEMLSSFSLGGITPFEQGESPENLLIHRLRSIWSAEGRLESIPVEELQLEPSWSKPWGVRSLRYGQIGTMPVRDYFPFIAVEDVRNNVLWGAQVAYAGSWQIEAYRKDDAICISGGLADREFGHWVKNLMPGQELSTPKAILSVSSGDIDTLAYRLTGYQKTGLDKLPRVEEDLPVIFNEWCTSWGKPTIDSICKLAHALKDRGIKYFVIDAGWFAEEGRDWPTSIGDWNPSRELYPDGIEKAAEVIRECGMIPGIWFELENCARTSDAFNMTDHLLKRDGYPLTAGDRRFWDMNSPYVIEYLTHKVIGLLKKFGFGYLKIDYNENVGIGCDGRESLGEGLRQQVYATQAFIEKICREVPGIVIENCASGGHRLEPSMMALTSMASFSDAHECVEIPIIAANIHRAILPRQSQIWAVLKKTDTQERIAYSIVNTFLGRMCLSGEITEFDRAQWKLVDDGISFYKSISHIIKDGFSRRYGPPVKSYRHPRGWQAMLRSTPEGSELLAVIHTFEGGYPEKISIPIPISGGFAVEKAYHCGKDGLYIEDNNLIYKPAGDFDAIAVHIIRT